MAAQPPASQHTHITGYRFVDLPDRDALRQPFRDETARLGLKGLVLLCDEGINFFVSGTDQACAGFIDFLEADERFRGIAIKTSFMDDVPYKRMLVKLKREIIALGMDEIRPADVTGAYVEPQEFKRWLDEGQDVLVLDTRNDYETRLGTFEGAVDLNLASFKQFPDEVVRQLPKPTEGGVQAGGEPKSASGEQCGPFGHPRLRGDTKIVMYCTGGVRCEKASAVMMNAGFKNVYQLDGGIMNYFNECGGAHWQGECFVSAVATRVASNLGCAYSLIVISLHCARRCRYSTSAWRLIRILGRPRPPLASSAGSHSP